MEIGEDSRIIFPQGGTNMSAQTNTNNDWSSQQKAKNERKFYRASNNLARLRDDGTWL